MSITFCGFVETQADAWILVHACLMKRLPFRTSTMNGRDSLRIASGSIYVQDANMLTQQSSDDEEEWQYLEDDGVVISKRARTPNEQWKKEVSIFVDGSSYWIECFYLPWETVDGTLLPPSQYPPLRDIADHSVMAVPDHWSPMRLFGAGLKVCSRHRSENSLLIGCRQLALICNSSFGFMWFFSLLVGQCEYHILNPSFHIYPLTPITGSNFRAVISFETNLRPN